MHLSPALRRMPSLVPSRPSREVTVKETNRSTAAVLQGSDFAKSGKADVFKIRERTRKRRLWRLITFLTLFDGYLWYRYLSHNPLQAPSFGPDAIIFLPLLLLVLVMVLVMVLPLLSGRSPHIVVRPEDIEIGLTEVQGLDTQVDEVARTLDVFLGYATFREELGGNPRRGILFEGPPGHRQDVSREGDGEAGRRAVPVHLGAGVPVDVVRHDGLPDPFVLQGPPQGGAQGRGRDRLHRGDRRDRERPRRIGRIARRHRARARGVEHGRSGRERHGERAADPDAVLRPAALASQDQGEHARACERLSAARQADRRIEAFVQQHPADRRDEPRRHPGLRAPATGAVRPPPVLRPPDEAGPSRADRLLLRAQGAPRGAGRRDRARALGARHVRVHAR